MCAMCDLQFHVEHSIQSSKGVDQYSWMYNYVIKLSLSID